MRKLLPILLLYFVLSSIYGQEESIVRDQFNYKVTYELTYQSDSTDIESIKSEDMFLYVGDKTSRFSSAGKAVGDSVQANFDYANFDQAAFTRMRSQIPRTAFEYYIYKGIPAEGMSYSREIIQDNYYYTEEKNLFDWIVLEETDTIAGYRVQKARTSFAGRDYIAWFAQGLPFPEGPYKFNGLPGLIVQIGDDKNHYFFKLTQLQKLRDPIPFSFKKEEYIKTSEEKLFKLEEEYKKDPVGFAERSVPGVKIQYESEERRIKIERERKEKLKRQNNPIELKEH